MPFNILKSFTALWGQLCGHSFLCLHHPTLFFVQFPILVDLLVSYFKPTNCDFSVVFKFVHVSFILFCFKQILDL